jgi:Bacteriophage probable baseplate hub protein
MTAVAYVSTPVLSLAGQVDADAISNLISLCVSEDVAGMCSCEARFNNFGTRNGAPGYLYLGRDKIDFGTALSVRFGPDGQDRQVFMGKVSALQADYPAGSAAQLLVFAEDGLQDFRLTRRTRSFADSSIGDIAAALASDHGLIAQADVTGPVRAVNVQLNQSDLAFLRDLARRDDAEIWLDGSTLHLQPRPDRHGAGPLTLSYGAELTSFSARADVADQCSTVTVAGWDVAAKDAISESADASALGAELGRDTSGADVLGAAFASRTETITRATPLTSDDARALARAAYFERARRFVCGTGQTDGTPQLRAGMTVTLAGLGGLFNGDYYVCATRHRYDLECGYRTEFDVERAGVGAAA